MKNKKGNILVILLAVTLIVSISAAVYFYWQTQQLQQPPIVQYSNSIPTQAPTVQDETANWKTYKNDVDGFSVKYPASWYVINATPVNQSGNIELSLLFDRKPIPDSYRRGQNQQLSTHPWAELNLALQLPPHSDAEIKRTGKSPGNILDGNLQDSFTFEPTIFNGLPANRSFSNSISTIGDQSKAYIIFNNKDFGWTISYPTKDFEGTHDPVYDQILSTFKFL